ncbi:FkbM family methyltransferase [Chelatococcus daeguensis]|uniref:Methyltransferase FkbM domain-containing protein n=1 Tax=Chelatococcus daeguensis TaxID=444444 RepID=A0AAC9P0G6_9HYPH|nr:FkbM family methyltransferase [Chelatococcus daeguensis]APF39517.1 hypothetical protein BOQ54_18720 [Chelatococcus daeguensis]KZE29126.1 hypothetical protein AVW15_04785 [Chelatococcus daeguensis]MBM3083831.1 FkbM family methyltransferase [Chelatococcus daeguensis]
MIPPFGLLVARQRSGTGALGSLLDWRNHPQFYYLGEIFHPDGLGDRHNYFTHLRDYVREDPLNALAQNAPQNFRRFLATFAGEGRTLLPDVKYDSLHSLNGPWHAPLARPWLLEFARAEGAPIIHLTRRNLLEVFVSGLLAAANQVWHTVDAAEVTIRSAVVDIPKLLRFIDGMQRERQVIEQWLDGHQPLVALDYQEMFDAQGLLASERADEIARAFGVDPLAQRRPSLVKQAPWSLTESIRNYDEVAKALAGTPHAWMLAGDGPPTTRPTPATKGLPVQKFVFQNSTITINGHSVTMHSITAPWGEDDNLLGAIRQGAFDEPKSLAYWLFLMEGAPQNGMVIDVGAYTGLYALLTARARPDLLSIAFEPSAVTFGRLIYNIQLNGFNPRIVPCHLAAWNREEILTLPHRYGFFSLCSGEKISQTQAVDHTETVKAVPLDAILQPARLDYLNAPQLAAIAKRPVVAVKIDVEGVEPEVLEGARHVIAAHRPAFICEALDAEAQNRLQTFFTSVGYAVEPIADERNVLAMPEDRYGGFARAFAAWAARNGTAATIGGHVIEDSRFETEL